MDNCLERCLKRSRGVEHSLLFQGKIHCHFQSLSASGAQLVFLSWYVSAISKSVPVGWENVRKDEKMFFFLHPVSFLPTVGIVEGCLLRKANKNGLGWQKLKKRDSAVTTLSSPACKKREKEKKELALDCYRMWEFPKILQTGNSPFSDGS